MANAPVYRHIVVTGPPGVGKTTVIKKTCELLKSRRVPVQGFYTEECREGSHRIGFDVITLTGDRQPLARLGVASGRGTVGKYGVLTSSFEAYALPALSLPDGDGVSRRPVIVLDEIGKMELFSGKFEHQVRQLMSRQDLTVLATIPEKRTTPIRLADEIRESATVSLWRISRSNRANVAELIADAVIKAYEARP